MVEKRDRRYSERYQFDNAKVYCQENSTLGFLKQFSEPFVLNDLTKGGMSFNTSKDISQGDYLQFKIDIPGRQKFKIKGKVVWVSNAYGESNAVGVQFLPFGTMKRYNSFTAREKLERIINPLQTPSSDTLQ
jgi:Tfp pilus assembly protein PilZ